MTQTLGVNERVSGLGDAKPIGGPVAPSAAKSAATGKFGTFAITFGIAFAILYTFFERMNWPLFTYHPAVGRLDFWMQPARSGEGPPMYWYGWLALAFPAAAIVGWIATAVSKQWLYRATLFCCILAALWPATFALAIIVADNASFDAEVLRSLWVAAIPAFVVAGAASYFISTEWAQRVWTSWLLIMPLGGLIILGYSLKQYFLR